ncbi:extracellular solute-binding protein [Kitasatospora paracochleata]|uniref:Multiple sugar transport system substrate-binding protein n=1 Tax=Kitasatospora paracochleata TaxID=58354 RepID=A0ABT1IW70_9ACTN|nr:extracellular solute-binding protein [Kitasatospora paracochleata]MCP2309387.1 multiple sugar transport system substrate-binding protein [Kitasatospora paracochleata]
MRKIALHGALTLVAAAVLAGCAVGGGATGPGAAGGRTTLTFLTFETPNLNASYWDAAIARASAKVPGVTIKKLVAPTVDRTAYAKQLDASGQLPDIMIAVKPDGFAQAGKLAPWTADELADYVVPKANPIAGKEYVLPYNTQPTPLVYYNKADFARAGISGPPSTYAQLVDDAKALKAKGINPFVVGGGGQDTWADMYPLIADVGTDVYAGHPSWLADRSAGRTTFADPLFVGAVRKVSALAAAGYIDPAGLSRSYADTEQAFRDDKGAMYPMGSWFAASADAKPPAFGVGVFAWPTDSGKLVVPAYTGGGLSVSSKAPDVALAKKWAAAFMEDKENLDASVKADGSIIAIKGYTPPSTMGPVYRATVDLYQQAVQRNGIVNAFTVESGDGSLPPGVVDKAALGMQDLINGKQTAEQFAAFLDRQWTQATQ